MNLRKKLIPCQEFPQGKDRTKADTLLYQLYRDGKVDNFDDPDLRENHSPEKGRRVRFTLTRVVPSEDWRGDEDMPAELVVETGQIAAALDLSLTAFLAVTYYRADVRFEALDHFAVLRRPTDIGERDALLVAEVYSVKDKTDAREEYERALAEPSFGTSPKGDQQ